MRKLDFYICENKVADQMCSNRTADQLLFFFLPNVGSTIPLPNFKFQASNHIK